ncbi:MAG: SUMF1/EgtB/PvdO family nonheme iron enzyme [Nibricoccus sp.]
MSDDFDQNDSNALRKLRPWLIGAGVSVALGGFYYFLATRGPRRVDASVVTAINADDQSLKKLSDEVAQSEAIWRAADEKGLGTSSEARAALALAVDKQRERVRRDPRSSPAESERLRQLERYVADAEVRERLETVSILEAEARVAQQADRHEEAVEKLRASLALLQKVNRSGADASLKDIARESRLQLDLEIMEAEPLSRQVMNARAKAEIAARAERWGEVREAFQELLAVQSRINREYPRTPFVDPAAEERIEGKIQSLQAESLAETVHDKVSGGEENMLAGNHAQAARLYGLAYEAQEKINVRFPKSGQYSPSRLDDLEARRQTALSVEPLAKIGSLDNEIAGLLKARDLPAAQKKIAEAEQLTGAVWRDFPRSRRLEEVLRERVGYRAAHSAVLAVIQEAVFSRVKSLPAETGDGSSPAKLLNAEVPQSLYVRVMDKNPSRTPDEKRPVDSVNWLEAREFCQRLGWLLGRPVRLPTEKQYRAALGLGGTDFIDLTGGLAEWLDSTDADLTAVIAGGSYLDAPETLATIPLVPVVKTERARHVGFRIVVE